MMEWEAKYKALLMAIDNETYITNAERMVKACLDISVSSVQPFDTIFYAMTKAISIQTLPLPMTQPNNESCFAKSCI